MGWPKKPKGPHLTLNDIIFLHFSLIVIVEAVDCVPLYVIFLVTLSIYYGPGLLNLLLTHLYRKEKKKRNSALTVPLYHVLHKYSSQLEPTTICLQHLKVQDIYIYFLHYSVQTLFFTRLFCENPRTSAISEIYKQAHLALTTMPWSLTTMPWTFVSHSDIY